MKNTNLGSYLASALIAACVLTGFEANSQERKLPDGTIIYSDGSRKLPNGTIIYKDGGKRGNDDNHVDRRDNGVTTLPDGTVIYPDGSKRYPNHEKRNKHYKHKNKGQWMPPGQAKKRYEGDAKDYAPGQHKKWKGKNKNKHHRD